MRDPARIEKILNKLRDYWHRCPDYRLGQIISNLSFTYNRGMNDPFSMEDDVLLAALEAEIEKMNNWPKKA